MTERARPYLGVVWERSFALEDAADEFYEQAEATYGSPFEVDRFDAHVVRIYLNRKALESHAESVEARFDPLGVDSQCGACSHQLIAHEPSDDHSCAVDGCPCDGFERDGEHEPA